MADSYTANLNLTLPEVGASRDTWGGKVNADMTAIDTVFNAAGNGTSVGLNVGTGKTLNVTGTANLDTAVVINESGADKDVRIEGDTDQQLFFTDASTDRVGIGINTPSAKLHVYGSIQAAGNFTLSTATGSYIYPYYISGTNHNYISSSAAGDIAFGAGTTGVNEVVRFTTSGNVGIGTSAPATKLDVRGTISTITSTGGTLNFNSTAAATTNVIGSYANNGNDFANLNISTNNTIFLTSGTERARIDSNGNVGIGTSSPTYGTLEVAQGSAGVVSVINNTGGAWAFRKVRSDGSNGMGLYDPSGFGQMAFYAAGSERARINSGGAFLVGTASTGSMAGGYSTQFIVVGDDRYTHNRMIIGCGSSTSSYDATIYPSDSGVIFNNNSGSRDYVFVKNSGAAYATVTAVINNVSDYRLKENVVDMDGALDKLARVRPVRYNFKDNIPVKMPWGEATVDGFIAHELQDVMPEAVYGEKDAVNEDGSIKAQQIDMTRLIPALVGAVQELKAELDAANARIAALEAK